MWRLSFFRQRRALDDDDVSVWCGVVTRSASLFACSFDCTINGKVLQFHLPVSRLILSHLIEVMAAGWRYDLTTLSTCVAQSQPVSRAAQSLPASQPCCSVPPSQSAVVLCPSQPVSRAALSPPSQSAVLLSPPPPQSAVLLSPSQPVSRGAQSLPASQLHRPDPWRPELLSVL